PPLFVRVSAAPRHLHSFPTRRSSDLRFGGCARGRRHRIHPPRVSVGDTSACGSDAPGTGGRGSSTPSPGVAAPIRVLALSGTRRSEEHTSELQSRENLVCRLLLEKKK